MIDKGIKYEVQGGVKNYLGKQKEVKAPVKWKSSPDHPETELAYITKKEKDLLIKSDLHGSLKGSVNRGPSGIISLNGWGDASDGFGGGAPGPGDTGGEGGNSPRDQSDSQFSGQTNFGGNDGVTYKGPAELGVTTRTVNKIDMPEPERDTGLERARQANIALADELSKYTPPPVNLPTLGPFSFLTNTLLQGPLDAFNKFTAEKNIDFFQENVAGKYGYGYGIEDFEQYMDDRQSGKVGAYGREINRDQGASGILENLLMPLAPILESQEGITSIPSQSLNYAYTPDRRIVIAPGTALGRTKVTI